MTNLVIVVLSLTMLGGLLGLFAAMKSLADGRSVAFTGGERALGKRKRFMRSGFLFISALSGLILLLVGFASGLVILLALAIVMACFEAALVNLKQ